MHNFQIEISFFGQGRGPGRAYSEVYLVTLLEKQVVTKHVFEVCRCAQGVKRLCLLLAWKKGGESPNSRIRF